MPEQSQHGKKTKAHHRFLGHEPIRHLCLAVRNKRGSSHVEHLGPAHAPGDKPARWRTRVREMLVSKRHVAASATRVGGGRHTYKGRDGFFPVHQFRISVVTWKKDNETKGWTENVEEISDVRNPPLVVIHFRDRVVHDLRGVGRIRICRIHGCKAECLADLPASLGGLLHVEDINLRRAPPVHTGRWVGVLLAFARTLGELLPAQVRKRAVRLGVPIFRCCCGCGPICVCLVREDAKVTRVVTVGEDAFLCSSIAGARQVTERVSLRRLRWEWGGRGGERDEHIGH